MLNTLRENIALRGLFYGWFAGATLFLLTNVILTPLMLEVGPAVPVRYFASLIMGQDVLLSDDFVPIAVGIIVHYVLAFVFTLVIVLVVHRWGLLVGIGMGALLGLSIYAINFYAFTTFFEWMFAIHSPVLVISHILFGATVGGIYEMFDTFDVQLSGNVSQEAA